MSAYRERNLVSHNGWLRVAVLGANDGIVSNASLIAGVAASGATPAIRLFAGSAAMVAGAMSMVAGGYVSVSAQADSEAADLAREHDELARDWTHEHDELRQIDVAHGLDGTLARQMAEQVMAHDALGPHGRDELGISEIVMGTPGPGCVRIGGELRHRRGSPAGGRRTHPGAAAAGAVVGATLLCLAILNVVGAKASAARPWRRALRVLLWGAAAMAVTMGIGRLVGHRGLNRKAVPRRDRSKTVPTLASLA